MSTVAESLKESVMKVLDELPEERIAEVLGFTLLIRERAVVRSHQQHPIIVKTLPVYHLRKLSGFISTGGDASAETEALYDMV